MNKFYLYLIVLILFSLEPVIALSSANLHFISPQNDDFSNYLLTLQLGEGIQKSILKNSNYTFNLIDGSYSLRVILDSFETPAPDFYGTADFTINGNGSFEILVFPVGFVQGTVKDKSGNLIPNANLAFNCFSSFVVDYPQSTDRTGSFMVSNIPEASCTIIASTDLEVGKAEFEVERGKAQNLDIMLESTVAPAKSYNTLIFLIILLFVIGIIIFSLYFYLKKRKLRPLLSHSKLLKKEDENPEEKISFSIKEKLSSQTKALLETLSEKEKSIVQFLLENNHESSQAKVRHATKLPRTSLARILQGLEAKKIILIEKAGKMVQIKLTSLFLGK